MPSQLHTVTSLHSGAHLEARGAHLAALIALQAMRLHAHVNAADTSTQQSCVSYS